MQQTPLQSMLESGWMRNQVETHLIFQFFVKHIPFAWVVLFYGLAYFIIRIVTGKISIDIIINVGAAVYWFRYLKKQSLYKQAALGWLFTKVVLSLFCLLIMILGPAYGGGFKGKGLLCFLLGVIWLPLIEYFPKVAVHQKHITAYRLILTVFVPYFIMNAGYF